MADDIVTRLRIVDGDKADRLEAADEIERLSDAVSELTSAFQTLTDQGDDCPLCWDIFKKSGRAVYCYGHAVIAEQEARRG